MILIDEFITLNAGDAVVDVETGETRTIIQVETIYDSELGRQITRCLILDSGERVHLYDEVWRQTHLVEGQANLLAAIGKLVEAATIITKLLLDGGTRYATWAPEIGALDKAVFEVATLIHQKGEVHEQRN